ncbi:flagellar biosynthesis protein FlhB [Sinimarinibacterium thermocellulolyticum]|uniref:Flagellar biosynthetic protein FlhB n=1 Tax=Sinimarinibacterium thermocellulolyticum TaxID=3170016 RepID=A0ABV2AA13_9GAMM
MSGQAGSQDRTERATPKRLRDARRRGEIARSRELVSFVVVAGGLLTLLLFAGTIANGAATWMQRALSPELPLVERPQDLARHFGLMLGAGFAVALPLLGAGFLAGIVGPILLGGWNVSAEALKADFKRVNPLSGLGRMFSAQSLVELGKALLKVGALGAIAVLFLVTRLDEIMALGREPLEPAMAHAMRIALGCLGWMCGGLLLIALIDAPYQLWSHAKKLRMTRQEVRQEHKETEGSPEVKGRQRQLQQQISRRRMMEAVPGADVVVVNPTHYAVALKYDAGKMRAPRVVAKGVDLIALSIRELARRHRIPIVDAPPLARALYRSAGLGDEIPAPLYAAVAQVLTYVYQLRDWRRGPGARGPRPCAPQIGEVPGGEADAGA